MFISLLPSRNHAPRSSVFDLHTIDMFWGKCTLSCEGASLVLIYLAKETCLSLVQSVFVFAFNFWKSVVSDLIFLISSQIPFLQIVALFHCLFLFANCAPLLKIVLPGHWWNSHCCSLSSLNLALYLISWVCICFCLFLLTLSLSF